MQQVGRQHFAKASLVNPRRLPAPIPVPARRPRMRALTGAGHVWVLHRRRVLQAILAAVVLSILATGYIFRNEIRFGFTVAIDAISGQVADSGFGVAQISITGQSMTREADIVRALEIDDFTSTLNFDADAARLRIEELPSVATATLRKTYPDAIAVTITENEAVARWRVDGHTFLIDSAGEPIADATFDDGGLMLVIGDGAGDDAQVMINLMGRFPALSEDLAALSRIGDRRWDLIYYTGLRVQLPETGVVDALNRLTHFQQTQQLLERDVDLIDMRVPEFVAVRPTVREEETQS